MLINIHDSFGFLLWRRNAFHPEKPPPLVSVTYDPVSIFLVNDKRECKIILVNIKDIRFVRPAHK